MLQMSKVIQETKFRRKRPMKTFPAGANLVKKLLGKSSGLTDKPSFTNEQLIETVRAGLAYSELEVLQTTLGLPMEQLASLVGLSRATLQRRKKTSGKLSLVQSDRVVRLAKLMGKAIDVLEGQDNARQWMMTPQHGLGGAIPLEYADTEVGAREVENLLGRIEHGVIS